MSTIICRGQGDVALWTGVTRAAVSNWMRRFPGRFPEPDTEIINEDGSRPVRGYLPERRPEWVAWAAELPGRETGSLTPARAAMRNARRTADQIYAAMEAGDIEPDVAARLLRELIGSPGDACITGEEQS